MDQFETLEKRIEKLGNHYQKYTFTIKRFKDSLIHALESSGKLMQVHLWQPSVSPLEEMKIIIGLDGDEKTKLEHLSCYYALQFLFMNSRSLDVLQLNITSGQALTDVYYDYIMQIGRDFRKLTAAYLTSLLDVYIPENKYPEFFICSVGTRADQDDIDVGIITAEGENIEEFNKTFQKVARNMLVYATPLHLYLSEHVGEHIYTTTIPEYKHLFKLQIQDVVIISELLNAKKILGSDTLFQKFQNEVISKYFYYPDQDIQFHEGFLRGILGEVRSLLISPPQNDAICPKDDALRMLKSILYAKKTICNVCEVNAWDIIDALIEKESHLKQEYEHMFKALSFLEMLKFFLQLYIVQEETFRLCDIDKKQLSIIAEKMGYSPIGTVSAWDQLIIDYYRYVKQVRKLCDFLLVDVSKHLSSVSLFVEMLKSPDNRDKKGKYKGYLAKDFIYAANFFCGTKYWEDVHKLLETDRELLDDFIDGFERLDKSSQKKVILKYIEWARYTPYTIIRFITILRKRQENEIGNTISWKLNLAFLQFIKDLPYTTERFCRIFSHYPYHIHEYLYFLPESHFRLLDRILAPTVIVDMLKPYQTQLKELCNIHKWSSQYFHRFIYRVISKHPEYLNFLTNRGHLSKIAMGLLAMVDVYHDYKHKKQALGLYYDLEFLRVGVGTMHGVELDITNRDFTEFCDQYIIKLFDICTKEIGDKISSVPANTDTFALLAAGGHARGQAYDDDYDLIAIVDTDDPEMIYHATRVVTRMNREILKRGVLPHYRLGEILGNYVSSVSRIDHYLGSCDEESFIDLSQLLGARVIVGSDVMKSVINEKILDKFIFNDTPKYIRRMIKEIRNRQESMSGRNLTEIFNLKETIGGLRDIEGLALILKAHLGIRKPISQNFFKEIKSSLPKISGELDIVTDSVYFLRAIRNLYRITVAADDTIQPDYFGRLANIFKYSNQFNLKSSQKISLRIQETLAASAKSCDNIFDFIQSN